MTREQMRREWLRVLNEAAPMREVGEAEFFASAEERIIARNLRRLEYVPRLPYGGSRERKMVKRLEAAARSGNGRWPWSARARQLAEAFQEVNGWLYERKKTARLSDKQMEEMANEMEICRSELRRDTLSDPDRRLYRDRLEFFVEWDKGFPNPVANFQVQPQFLLVRREGRKEKRDRKVTMKNASGEETLLIDLPSDETGTPHDFKTWCQNQGRYDFIEGEKTLCALKYDTNQRILGFDVYQLYHYGWHGEAKMWVAGDGAVLEDGSVVLPDENNILWVGGIGYTMSERDIAGQPYRMGKPSWRLSEGLTFNADGAYELAVGQEDDLAALRDLVGEYLTRVKEYVGGEGPDYAGYLAVGAVLSYGLAPEFFARTKYFSGLYIHGQTQGGKGTLVDQLMPLWGFSWNAALNLSSTDYGLRSTHLQYENLPVRLEEANNLRKEQIEFLKSTHNREPRGKFSPEGVGGDEILTAPIIIGEHTSSEASLQNRFPHVQVARERRRKLDGTEIEHLPWFNENRGFFFAIGRWVLRHRGEFARRGLEHWRQWVDSEAMQRAEPRLTSVHGCAYGAMMAVAEMLGVPARAEMDAFRAWLIDHTYKSVASVRESVNVNVLWQHIIDAFKQHVFGETLAEQRRYFHVIAETRAHPPGREGQVPSTERPNFPGWVSYRLYFDYNSVLEMVAGHLRRMGKDMPVSRKDFRAQIEPHPYFIRTKPGGTLKQRMGSDKAPTSVWGVELDLHPMGLQPTQDEEVFAAYDAGHDEYVEEDKTGPYDAREWRWDDPRKGELYLIVQALAEK